jgi:hypothetical protein
MPERVQQGLSFAVVRHRHYRRPGPLLYYVVFFRVVSTRWKVSESWTWWRRLLPMDSHNERRSSNIIAVVGGNRRTTNEAL